jgi:membrane protease YdiL (CAAX protease family)
MAVGDRATNDDDSPILPAAEDRGPVDGAEPGLGATSRVSPRAWGPWGTIGWTLVCLASVTAVQVAVLIAFSIVGSVSSTKGLSEITLSSLFVSTSTLASTPVLIGLVAVLIYARGCPIREYLALHMPKARQAALAIAGLAMLLFAGDLTTYLLGRPVVPQVMIDIYKTGWPLLLLPTLMIAAPLGEETLFRGFLYQGIASSRWGATMAVLVSAVAWASIHVQYDWYSVSQVAVTGIYLGEVRRRADSLPLTVLLHGIANAVATVEVMVMVHIWGQ